MFTEESFLRTIRHTVIRHDMLQRGLRLGVAVSGGVDSAVLLDALCQLQPDLGLQLRVVHVDHRIRPDSLEDVEFVCELAEASGLTCHVMTAEEPAPSADVEQWGRKLRYQYFQRLISDRVIDSVATAHTRSDQAETVLMRLLRGSGLAGLAGITPVTSAGVVRPMLYVSRDEVRNYAELRSLCWREDSSNADERYLRNRVRHALLPQAERVMELPVAEVLAATAEIARDEERYWSDVVEETFVSFVDVSPGSCILKVDLLRRLHPAVVRRLVRRCICHVRGDLRNIDLRHVESVIALTRTTEGSGRTQLPGTEVMRSFDYLRIAVPNTRSRFERMWSSPMPNFIGGSRLVIPAGTDRAILLEMSSLSAGSSYTEGAELVDSEHLAPECEFRSWQPGDVFRPPGRSVQRVKTLFQEARIPIWERAEWPVLASGSTVYWTRLWGAAESVLPREGTRRVLVIREVTADVAAD